MLKISRWPSSPKSAKKRLLDARLIVLTCLFGDGAAKAGSRFQIPISKYLLSPLSPDGTWEGRVKMKKIKLLPVAMVLLLAACRVPAGPTPSSTICGSPIPQYSDLITIRGVHIQDKSDVGVRGESALPDGTCILTQLCEDDVPLVWWPANRCALVEDGRWDFLVHMGEVEGAPDDLSDTAMYILRAWQRDNPAVEALYFPLDLQGPPPESTPVTPAPMASLLAPTKTSSLPEMLLTVNAPASTPGSTSTAMTTSSQNLDTEIVFTIVNKEQYRGRVGEPKPDWLAWGAQAFTLALDGSFWIADSAAEPPRLLHFNPNGEMLQEVHQEGQVVGLADVAADGDHVWVLSIASMPPKVLRFTPEGIYTESYNLPEGLRPENGLTGIALAENGALLVELEGGVRLFRLVDENGELDPQPVSSPYPKSWVTSDGSYYLDTFEMDPGPTVQGKRLVRYYRAEGMLVGELDLPEPAVYAQHDLALGPDGRLYFMISRADRSVEIWRLGFEGESFPKEEVTPSPSPTPLSPLLPAWETPPPGASDLVIARQTLIRFFTFLHDGLYGEAAALYGGSYEDLPVVRDDLPPTSEDKALVWESECELLQCLLISRVVEETQVSPDEYRFVVEFMNEDGTLFVLGPCCGATEAEMPPVWQWLYSVKRVDGQFKVMEAPVFVP
jgi:hypothetical protein